MLAFSVKTNRQKLDQILKRTQASQDDELRVGFFADSVYEDGTPVAQVAVINDKGRPISEFGPAIPPRPFMTVGATDMLKSKKFKSLYKSLIRQILKGSITVRGAYDRLGQAAVQELKDIITAWSTPPNSPYTQSIKGFDDPLVWTGKMRDSVAYRVAKSRKNRVVRMTTKVR